MAETTKLTTKFTPGPWEWNDFGGNMMLMTVGRGKLVVLQPVRKGMQGAQFLMRDGHCVMREMSTDHPDARLIKAAPDLLKATDGLRHLVRCMATGPGWTQELMEEILAAADAAIAQVEGRS